MNVFAFKKLNNNDITITPYNANKEWVISSSSLSNYNINTYYLNGSINTSSFDLSDQYNKLCQYLYYSNYVYNNEITGSIFTNSTGSFINYLSNTGASGSGFSDNRIWNDDNKILFQIPQDIFGNKIIPGSFLLEGIGGDYFILQDDGNGNLIYKFDDPNSNFEYCGNLIYGHGIILINNVTVIDIINNNLTDYNISFKNEYIIYENEIKCLVERNEFNYSQNPTILENISGSLKSFATSSQVNLLAVTQSGYFNPYATTIGIYNDSNELLMVGKLSSPIPISPYIDTTFILKYDL